MLIKLKGYKALYRMRAGQPYRFGDHEIMRRAFPGYVDFEVACNRVDALQDILGYLKGYSKDLALCCFLGAVIAGPALLMVVWK